MDPFLENHWGDVHTSLTTYARNQLQPQLPPGLRARVEEYVAVELDAQWSARKPDIRVIEEPVVGAQNAATAVLPDLSEELVIDLDAEPRTERSVWIVDQTSGERVVTSIEFLSLWNKDSSEGREAFRREQRELLDGGVNLVEIDLIRGDGWALSVSESVVPATYRYPYRICVRRASERSRAVCYRVTLQERLPVIRIPLRAEDNDIRLDVQKLIDDAWQDGGYFGLSHLHGPLPPFSATDADWIRERIQAAPGG
jgi:hypothetical protein